MFLVSLGNTAVLTRAQEVELCAILQRGMRLERAAVAQQHQLGRLPTLDDVATAGGLASGAEVAQVARNRAEAEDLMVQHNMRLVFSVCKRYLNRGVELSDLLMDGVAGMRRALLRFDPAKGFKFSTYCHWWIRQAVTRSINGGWACGSGVGGGGCLGLVGGSCMERRWPSDPPATPKVEGARGSGSRQLPLHQRGGHRGAPWGQRWCTATPPGVVRQQQ